MLNSGRESCTSLVSIGDENPVTPTIEFDDRHLEVKEATTQDHDNTHQW
jgi:hypothetical protein